jgi:hypothetical protein
LIVLAYSALVRVTSRVTDWPATTFTVSTFVSRPEYTNFTRCGPAGTPCRLNTPPASAVVDSVVPSTDTIALRRYSAVPWLRTRPVIDPVAADWPETTVTNTAAKPAAANTQRGRQFMGTREG